MLLHGQNATETHPVKSMYSTSEIDYKIFINPPPFQTENNLRMNLRIT